MISSRTNDPKQKTATDAWQSNETAIRNAHAENRAFCLVDDEGTHLFFPDLSKRYFPSECFTTEGIQRTRLRYFVRWTEFMRGLYSLLDRAKWASVMLRFGPHDKGEPFVVHISAEGINRRHWQEALALSRRIVEKYKHQDARAAVPLHQPASQR